MNKKIGFFVESFGVGARPNGICTKAIIDELVKKSCETVVFSSKTIFRQPYKQIEKYITVYKFNRDMGYMVRILSNKYNQITKKLIYVFSRIFSVIQMPIIALLWPMRSPILIMKYYKLAKLEHKRKKFDTIVAVYLYIEEVIAAILLKIKHPEIKLIIYTLDALSAKDTPKRYPLSKITIKKWEKYIFKHADIICVLESHRNHYKQEKYNDIRHKIEYTDIPLFKPREGLSPIISNRKSGISIVYTGSTTFVSGDPGYFLEILKKLDNVLFHLYGVTDDYVKKQIDESGLVGKRIFIHGKVNHTEIKKIHDEADFLISFGSKNSNMIPSKIFEYISSRKPIINFYKIVQDPAYPYIEKYPDKIQICESLSNLEENVELLKLFIFNTKRAHVSNTYLLKTYKENTPFPMIDLILNKGD